MADEAGDVVPSSPDIHFEPIIKLPLVEIKTLEENEDTLFTMRAKLFRFDSSEDPAEWKERGTGEVKILKHKDDNYVRILMRRDKTLKICANHYIQSYMELKPNSSSDRAWVWNTMADFADEEPKPELLAIKFASVENAQKFKTAFDEAKDLVALHLKNNKESSFEKESETESSYESPAEEENDANKTASPKKDTEEVTDKLCNLTVEEESKSNGVESEVKEDKKE